MRPTLYYWVGLMFEWVGNMVYFQKRIICLSEIKARLKTSVSYKYRWDVIFMTGYFISIESKHVKTAQETL